MYVETIPIDREILALRFEHLTERFRRPITALVVGAPDGQEFRQAFRRRNKGDVVVFVGSRFPDSKDNTHGPQHEIFLSPQSNLEALRFLARFEHFDVAWLEPTIAADWRTSAILDEQQELAELVATPTSVPGASFGRLRLETPEWLGDLRQRDLMTRHSEITDRKVSIEVGLQAKEFVQEARNERRSWIPGISLNTFLELGGISPSRLSLASILGEVHLEHTHGDFEPWNLILDGKHLTPIDTRESRGLNDERQKQIVEAHIFQLRGYEVYDLPALDPSNLENSFALTIWAPVESCLPEIEAIIRSRHEISFAASFEFLGSSWSDFLSDIYKNVATDATAISKRAMLERLPHRAHLVMFRIPGEEFETIGPPEAPPHVAGGLVSNRYNEINQLKEQIREQLLSEVDWQLAGLAKDDEYFKQFAVVHATDSLRQSRELVRFIASRGVRIRPPSAIRYFDRFLAFLERHEIAPETVSIVDSAVLAMLGLRANRDLDFIVDPTTPAFEDLKHGRIETPPGLHWVRDWSRNPGIPDYFLIYSPLLYVRHLGIKIGRLEPLLFNKKDMGRQKDLEDVERIQEIRESLGWDAAVFDFFANSQPYERFGSTLLCTLADVESIVQTAQRERRVLNPRELRKIPPPYWSMHYELNRPVVPDHLFPLGEETKTSWFFPEQTGAEEPDFLDSSRNRRCETRRFIPQTIKAEQITAVGRHDVGQLLREKSFLALHFYEPDKAARSTLRHFVETGFWHPKRIVATVGGRGAPSFRDWSKQLANDLRIVHQETLLDSMDWKALKEICGVRPRLPSGERICGKGLTDWCTALVIAALGLEAQFVLFSDTDLELIERYEPAFHLGAALSICQKACLNPIRILPACAGRNNEPVVAAIHNLAGQQRVALALGNSQQSLKLEDHHEILASQLWPIAGEHLLPFQIGDVSPILDMPYPTGYGIEMFISCFLADCARLSDEQFVVAQPEIRFPRVDRLNSHAKEFGTLNLMAVFLGLLAEYPKRIVDFTNEDLKILNREILPSLDRLHIIDPVTNSKKFLPFDAGSILPPPRVALEHGWVDVNKVLDHLES